MEIIESAFVTLTPGVAWVVVGQPFDVVRVRLATQQGANRQSVLACVRKTFAVEGVSAFWKGSLPALLMSVPYSMLMFGIYFNCRPADPPPDVTPSAAWYADVFTAGMVSGIPMSLIQNPLDCWRVRCATAPPNETGFTVLRNTLLRDSPAVLLRGFALTSFRNVPGGGLYFAAYEGAVGAAERQGWFPSSVSREARSAVLGAVTGSAVALLLHPTEVLRANMQNTGSAAGGMRTVLRTLVAQRGWTGLYAGVGVATFKSLPVNFSGFYVITAAQDFVSARQVARSQPTLQSMKRRITFTTQP